MSISLLNFDASVRLDRGRYQTHCVDHGDVLVHKDSDQPTGSVTITATPGTGGLLRDARVDLTLSKNAAQALIYALAKELKDEDMAQKIAAVWHKEMA